jgi:hypothetical protein
MPRKVAIFGRPNDLIERDCFLDSTTSESDVDVVILLRRLDKAAGIQVYPVSSASVVVLRSIGRFSSMCTAMMSSI